MRTDYSNVFLKIQNVRVRLVFTKPGHIATLLYEILISHITWFAHNYANNFVVLYNS